MAVYTGSSIVDYLKSVGQPSDFASRAKLATQKGITNYIGSAEQNTQLLGLLRGSAQSAPTGGAGPQFSPARGIGSTWTEPKTGTTWRFNESQQWQQISTGARSQPSTTQPPAGRVPAEPTFFAEPADLAALERFGATRGDYRGTAIEKVDGVWRRSSDGARVVTSQTAATATPAPSAQAGEITQSITGDSQIDRLLSVLEQQLIELQRRGQIVNPNIDITPERLAEFTKQAESEINPFYQTQLKLARTGFLSSIGYTRQDILKQEEDLSRKFKQEFRGIGEEAAEKGFALSGLRRRGERELAGEAQRQAEDIRTRTGFEAQEKARTLAQQFGAGAISPITLPETLRFTPSGEVIRGTRELSFGELGSGFEDLIGEQEFARRGAIRTRESGLEEAERERLLARQARTLTL